MAFAVVRDNLKGPRSVRTLQPRIKIPTLPCQAACHHGTHKLGSPASWTGVVTIGAVAGAAAQIDGKGAGDDGNGGLAQPKGRGRAHPLPVLRNRRKTSAPNFAVANGRGGCVIGGDLVVFCGTKTTGLTRAGRTGRL